MARDGISWIGAALMLAVTPFAPAQPMLEPYATITASDGEPGDMFGRGIDVDGSRALIGAWGNGANGPDSGSAYVFEFIDGTWTEAQKLTPSDGHEGDRFGWSVSLDGDTAVIGAVYDDDHGESSGSAYVFERIDGSWTQTAKLLASDGLADDQFGFSVCVTDGAVVIGAPYRDAPEFDNGGAYVFERIDGVWTQVAILTSWIWEEDHFGWNVAGDDGRLAVAMPSVWDPGSVSVFERIDGIWTGTASLWAGTYIFGDGFGHSLAMSGATVLVGQDWDDDVGGPCAYIFSGSSLSATVELDGFTDGAPALDVSGDRAIVANYVLERDLGWEASKRLSVDSAPISLDGNAAMVRAPLDDTLVPGEVLAYDIDLTGTVPAYRRLEYGWCHWWDLGGYYDECGGDTYEMWDLGPWATSASGASHDSVVEPGHVMADLRASASSWPFEDTYEGSTSLEHSFEVLETSTWHWRHTASAAGNAGATVRLTGFLDLILPGGTPRWTNRSLTLPLGEYELELSVWASDSQDGSHASGIGSDLRLVHAGEPEAIDLGTVGEAGNIEIDTFASDFDTSIAVFDSAGSVVAQNDDDGGPQSRVSFSAAPDVYYLAVAGAGVVYSDGFGVETASAGPAGLIAGTIGGLPITSSSIAPGQVQFYPFGVEPEPYDRSQLFPADGSGFDRFGTSVSLKGAAAIVGASGDDTRVQDSGSAYIFAREGGAWGQQAKLVPDDAARWDRFGESVSIDGDTAIIGAYRNGDFGPYSGSAYIFARDGGDWIQQAKLLPDDGEAGDSFGLSVSIDRDTAIVGARGDDDFGSYSGSAYIFIRDGGDWIQQAKLLPNDSEAGDSFGRSVSIDGDTAIIGASESDDIGSYSGSAYIFIRDGGAWIQQAKLLPDDGEAWDLFGLSVSIDGDTVIIGATGDDNDGSGPGSAYVFERTGVEWIQRAKLRPEFFASGDGFGYSVALDVQPRRPRRTLRAARPRGRDPRSPRRSNVAGDPAATAFGSRWERPARPRRRRGVRRGVPRWLPVALLRPAASRGAAGDFELRAAPGSVVSRLAARRNE
jgi:hypothetical protein